MTEAQHDPAPWTIEEYGDDECPSLVIHKDTESRVCFMATPGSHGDPAVITANAHLIAAAPDLLAALQAARPHIGVGYSAGQRHAITSLVDAAIAKARGAK
jgi:hypothetical protein